MVTPKLYQPFIHYLPWLCVPKSTEWTDCLREGAYSKCMQGWVLEFHFRRWKEAEKSSKGDEEAGEVGRKYFKPSDRFYQCCWESKTRQNYHWTWQNCCCWQHWWILTERSGQTSGVDWKGGRWGSRDHGLRRLFSWVLLKKGEKKWCCSQRGCESNQVFEDGK